MKRGHYKGIATRKAEIVQMRLSGATREQVAEHFSLCRDTISSILREAGIPPRKYVRKQNDQEGFNAMMARMARVSLTRPSDKSNRGEV